MPSFYSQVWQEVISERQPILGPLTFGSPRVCDADCPDFKSDLQKAPNTVFIRWKKETDGRVFKERCLPAHLLTCGQIQPATRRLFIRSEILYMINFRA